MNDTAVDVVPQELRLPPFGEMLTARFYLPFLVYFAFFSCASAFIRKHTFTDFTGFRQYRLHNLTVCVLHSVISGSWVLSIFWNHWDEAFNDVFFYYSELAAQLPILSIAYFTHDAIHMLCHEWSLWTVELLAHHIATTAALLTGVLAKRFLFADFWALLMEVNSVFLHLRTILLLIGCNKSRPWLFRLVVHANIITFVIFRVVAQVSFGKWCWLNRNQMHVYYFIMGFGGELFFSLINGVLLVRVLAADGFLGEKFRGSRDRDAPRPEEKKDE